MTISEGDAAKIIRELQPMWERERRKLDRIDRWARWEHDDPHRPRHATREYRELAARAQAPWGDLVVGSVAQTLYLEGYGRADQAPEPDPENPDGPESTSTGWAAWQANGMDGTQVALHRGALTYGLAYVTCLPGKTLGGDPMPAMRGVSPRNMLALFDDPASDEWPIYTLGVTKVRGGYELELLDASARYTVRVSDLGDIPKADGMVVEEHGAGVCPVVRYTNRMDLEGRTAGEIEPFIPLFGKIDQTSFDRLVVQRFASWIVRTIAGMSVTESAAATSSTVDEVKMRLRVEDMLTAEDHETKFGSLPATPLDGFIKAHESDLKDLAAVSQTPAFELMGDMANLSAEALAAAKASQDAKSDERRHTLGAQHAQLMRLACHLAGDAEGAADFRAQVRWADTSIRSLSQAADALGKLSTMLGIPPQVLWTKVPGLTQQDIDEATAILAKQGGMDALLERLAGGQVTPEPAPA